MFIDMEMLSQIYFLCNP